MNREFISVTSSVLDASTIDTCTLKRKIWKDMGTQKALLINIITASLHDHRTMYILYS